MTAFFAISTATVLATPAWADDVNADYLAALANAGITDVDPGSAVAVGQQVCPLLGMSLTTMQFPDVASHVARSLGRSEEDGGIIAGIAIDKFCSPALGPDVPAGGGGLFAGA